jgi:hypothetical protein
MQGLGLLPYYSIFNLWGWLFYILKFLLVIAGCYLIFKKSYNILKCLLLSALIQILAIVVADYITGYFFAARQILFLLPINTLLVGLAIDEVSTSPKSLIRLRGKREQRYFNANRGLALLLISSMMIFSTPINASYYRLEKSESREISEILTRQYQPGETIWVIPKWNALSFEYYLIHRFNRPDIASAVKGTTTQELYDMGDSIDQAYLIVCRNYMSVHPDWLKKMRFSEQPVGENPAYSAELLFTRH